MIGSLLGISLVMGQPITLPVVPKESWGLQAKMGKCNPHSIRQITIHHSGTKIEKNKDVIRHLKSYQRYHLQQGWMDIAYHFIIDLEGNVYQGRSLDCEGDTFTNYKPNGHLIIMVDGNYEEQSLSTKSWESLRYLVQWGMQTYQVQEKFIHPHQALADTLCPGHALMEQLHLHPIAASRQPIILTYMSIKSAKDFLELIEQ